MCQMSAGSLVQGDEFVEFVWADVAQLARLSRELLEALPRILVRCNERIDVHLRIYGSAVMTPTGVEITQSTPAQHRPSQHGPAQHRPAQHGPVQHGAERPHGIVTPEAVVLDLETAGFASRLTAALIDLTILVSGAFVIMLIVAVIALRGASESTITTVGAIVVFALLFGYPILFETFMRGRTPGKAALRLRAVTIDGAPITLREATLRAMGGVVDRLLPPGGITGVLFVLTTPRHQRVGDLIAGTIVIRDPRQYVPAPALWFSPPWGLDAYADLIDPTAITVEQYTVIRSFLTRVATLAPNVRAALALDLADRMSEVVRFPRHQNVAPEAYLLCVISRYQRSVGPATGR